jgi:hypothetical protein
MKKLIFLDIDGVLNNTSGAHQNGSQFKLDSTCVNLLFDILNQTGAKIVISSSWRHGSTLDNFKLLFKQELYYHKISPAVSDKIINSIIGLTVDGLLLDMTRGGEIRQWLVDNKFNGNYAIIDDIPSIIGDSPYLFATNCKLGITKQDATKIINHLKKNKKASVDFKVHRKTMDFNSSMLTTN